METSHQLLHGLLDYIGEHAKEVDLRAFRVSAATGFIRRPRSLAGLPGVTFDAKVEGDHLWLKVDRLIATEPPMMTVEQSQILTPQKAPSGAKPAIDKDKLQKLVQGRWIREPFNIIEEHAYVRIEQTAQILSDDI